MFAYRHAFHAGNHADVLKHLTLVQLLLHLNQKEKGWRLLDTHAGAGLYALTSAMARKKAEHAGGIGRLWALADTPPAVREYLELVRGFNPGGTLRRYPGSPAIAEALRRPQDELRLFELHPADQRLLARLYGRRRGVTVSASDGFASLKALLPPPTRRGLTLIDPSYEIKTDYARVLAAYREALARFADGIVMIWLPQLQLLDAAQLPQRLKASSGPAKKGWLHARLTVDHADERGFGLIGSSVFVANPPHTLAPALREALPWLARQLGRAPDANARVETGS